MDRYEPFKKKKTTKKESKKDEDINWDHRDRRGVANETDPLLQSGGGGFHSINNLHSNTNSSSSGTIRSRRSISKSPLLQNYTIEDHRPMIRNLDTYSLDDNNSTNNNGVGGLVSDADEHDGGYQSVEDSLSSVRSRRQQQQQQELNPINTDLDPIALNADNIGLSLLNPTTSTPSVATKSLSTSSHHSISSVSKTGSNRSASVAAAAAAAATTTSSSTPGGAGGGDGGSASTPPNEQQQLPTARGNSSSSTGGGSGGYNAANRGRGLVNNNNNPGIPADARSVDSEQPPLLEIPEEVYAVRKAALQVLKPLNKTWVVISVGFSLTVLFGMAKWTRLLPVIPFWFIVLPCWSSHVGLLWLHILSARALSSFIAEANESRQRPDSRDHLNRTEYLPLLQRSLKFGLKTGILSFFMFLFEILIYVRVARGTISLGVAFIPLWLLVLGGILDGLICKSQHFLRVVCWILTFISMILTVLKADYGHDEIRWTVVMSPIITVLSIASASLIYIVYGHQIGFYRLTEAQLTAGNLYSLAALICIVLIVMIGEVIPLSRPVEVETRLFVVILAPLVVCLVGMGAWVISRDEFGRLLLYGGQSAVHPMKLRWEEGKGWTSVQGRGVTVIPMFGEVSFQPLEKSTSTRRRDRINGNTVGYSQPAPPQPQSRVSIELLSCCTRCTERCYPTEDDEDADEEKQHLTDDIGYHPYLDSDSNRNPPRNHYPYNVQVRGV